MDDPEHIFLKENIVNELHTNKSEHKEGYVKFVFLFVFFALVGIISGGLVDFVSKKARNNSTSKIKCFGILSAQLFVIGSVFFFLMQLRVKSGIVFDDWMMGTWSGFIFSLTFFTSQKSLSDLIEIVIK